jgi:hypothetical protein
MDFGHCEDREEFVMMNPMTPINRSNLSMIGLAGTLDISSCTEGIKQAWLYLMIFSVQLHLHVVQFTRVAQMLA